MYKSLRIHISKMLSIKSKRLFLLSGIAGALFLTLVLWRLPQWTVPPGVTDPKERAELLNANRENVLKVIQTISGLGFIATAYLTWRNFQIAEDKNATDRFSKSVEMLSNEKIEIRLGGIYSLERIAKDLKEDAPVVMEVLTAFIRNKTRLSKESRQSFIDSFSPREMPSDARSEHIKLEQDIQSALSVIGRCNKHDDQPSYNVPPLDLSESNLSGIHLDKAYLKRVRLDGTRLEGAHLRGTNLSESRLWGANLKGADLKGAILCGARLGGAILKGACLEDTNLQNAHLDGADLEGAFLDKANLQETSFVGAKGMTVEQFTNTKLCRTVLPENISLDSDRDC
ncbi:pentapeptide repeat-containing protein [Phormidium tenue]|uniref:Low-complexity protein n=1 Tax=Phormidium tenue NIES-30 TaxID=549789 RepID=A0A1U7IY25_9CYAN|nr:pentapeptide repeat-containing protein [Phormidium tenue]MBD2234933.1 pentapeptide repeat-containing protein [Phormidium tenue FACHB-1052]OKH43472.1 hypothetical protein NIES30_25000 [Phormidium tenue NIES-30]